MARAAAGDAASVEAGRAALARGAWARARTLFAAGDSAAHLEGLSWAAWWQDDVDACLDARARAYRAYREAGDCPGAARMALWLSDDHIEFRREEAVAGGWLQRAASLLQDEEECAEHGWLALFEAHAALLGGDARAALPRAAEGREIGRRLGVADVELFGLVVEGLALVACGRVAEGLRRLDEGTAAALGGDIGDLRAAGWACCCMISACEQVRDHDRAAQWCRRVEQFSRRLDIRFVHGTCRAHYAGVLTWRGAWEEAELELAAALETLTVTRPIWRSEAVVRLGDLRRRQGRFAEAEQLFAQAPRHSLAQLGLAELALDRGEPEAALSIIERLARAAPPGSPVRRAGPLELLVRAAVSAGQAGRAAAAAAELRVVAAALGTAPLTAASRFSDGLVAAAAGDGDAARAGFEDAVDCFEEAGAPLEAARARVQLAVALHGAGRTEAAAQEGLAALARLDALPAPGEAARARAALERLGVATRRAGPLTAREVEVLRLVAEGLVDRQIAERLVLSEHTVHRHVANIHAKLGCSSRAAAVAAATRHRLL